MPPKFNQHYVNHLLFLSRGHNSIPDDDALSTLAAAIAERQSALAFVYDGTHEPEWLALLVTDLERFTTTMQALGDEEGRDFMRVHNRILRDCLMRNHGTEIAHTGDGFIASFANPSHALHCARSMQQALEIFNADRSSKPAMRIRIGVHSGRPLFDEERLIGTAVNTAVRICAAAEGAQVLASVAVVSLFGDRWFTFHACGKKSLKGLAEPLELYEFDWRVHSGESPN